MATQNIQVPLKQPSDGTGHPQKGCKLRQMASNPKRLVCKMP